MKKNVQNKLVLNRETVRTLDLDAIRQIVGGGLTDDCHGTPTFDHGCTCTC